MAKGKRMGKSIKTYYKNYSLGKWEENATTKLEKHIAKQPDDTVAKEALKRLTAGKKKYTRNRKSEGHVCKDAPSIALKTSRGDDRLTIIQQMEHIGFKYRGRRNKKTFRQGMARVR